MKKELDTDDARIMEMIIPVLDKALSVGMRRESNGFYTHDEIAVLHVLGLLSNALSIPEKIQEDYLAALELK